MAAQETVASQEATTPAPVAASNGAPNPPFVVVDDIDAIKRLSVSERVCLAKAEIEAIGKTGWNEHGEYHHATVDDVYHAARPILARLMLDLKADVIHIERYEVPRQGGGVSQWLSMTFHVWFEGEAPVVRPLMMALTGPQTFEAAQSYVAKQYLRQRLQLETGEYDADSEPQNGIPRNPERENLLERIRAALDKAGATQAEREAARRFVRGKDDLTELRKYAEQLEVEADPQTRRAQADPQTQAAPAANAGQGRRRRRRRPAAEAQAAPEPPRDPKQTPEWEELSTAFNKVMDSEEWSEDEYRAGYEEFEMAENLAQAQATLLRWDKLLGMKISGEADLPPDEDDSPPAALLNTKLPAKGKKLEDGTFGAEIKTSANRPIVPGQRMQVQAGPNNSFPSVVAEVLYEEEDDEGNIYVTVRRDNKAGKALERAEKGGKK